MSPRLEIFKIYRSILVWPILKPAPKFFLLRRIKDKVTFLHLDNIVSIC